MKKTTGFFLAVMTLFVVGSAWVIWTAIDSTTPEYEGPVEDFSVRLGWVHQAQFAGFYVAKEKGFYEDVGLNVNLLEADGQVSQTSELVRGDVDASIMEAHQLLAEEENVEALVAVAAIYQINPHALAARADSGITVPEDLSGKVIGQSGGASEGDAIFKIFLEDLHLEEEVTFVELGFDTVDDFKNNRADVVDVYSIDQPFLAQAEGIPLNIIPLDAYGFSTYGDVVVTRRVSELAQKDQIARFVQATFQGWEYAFEHQEEAIDITLQYAHGVYADREYQEHILSESIPLIRGGQRRLGRMNFVPWSTLFESMKRFGVISGDIDLRDVYTNEFIP